MSISSLRAKQSTTYDVGAEELRKAQKAMKQLKDLKVDKDTYKRAEDSLSDWNWNWITGDDAQKEKIEKQTKLEREIARNLHNIAAAEVRNPDAVSDEVMKEAKSIESQLYDRLVTDYDKATKADAGTFQEQASGAMSEHFQLNVAMENGDQQDVIPLNETQAFIDQFLKDDFKLRHAKTILSPDTSTALERDKARTNMAEATNALDKKCELIELQIGTSPDLGIADAKYWALPEGDPLKNPYKAQNDNLEDLLADFRMEQAKDTEVV